MAASVVNSSTPSSISGAQQQVLFAAGTGGYGCYRIPALVRTADGSLLAFAEGRKTQSCGDRGDTDLVERRSTNDGRTWSPVRVVASGDTAPLAYGTGTGSVPPGVVAGSPVTRTNPAPVVDVKHGRVYLLSTSDPVNFNTPRTPWVQESTDDGLTWTAPTALHVPLATTPSEADWYATGPGHGVQLTTGPDKDRLVVGAHEKSGTQVFGGYLYLDPNDTDTATWKAAGAVDSHAAPAGGYSPAEVSVTEVSGGHVYAVARAEDTSAKGAHRLGSTDVLAPDGTTPSVPAFADESLPSPGNIQGSVLTVQQGGGGHKEEVLLSAPAGVNAQGQPSRTTMTVWTRCNGSWLAGKKVSDGRAGYSDLALLADQEIGLLYEGGSGYSAAEIRFTRFDQAQLANGCNTPPAATSHQAVPPAAASTPDASPQANDGYPAGTASLGSSDELSRLSDVPGLAGVTDRNLVLGAGGYVDVPYARSLRTGTGDFTYSMWFKYQSRSDDPDRVLFWSYGTGNNKPQAWLRTQAGVANRLYAVVQSSATDQASVAFPDPKAGRTAFGDNLWHFVTLTRTGSRLHLQVDDLPATDGAGAVTGDPADTPQNDVLGIRVGAKPDSVPSNPFVGKIDEFRLYRGALTTTQRTSIAGAATSGGRVSGSADPQADDRANAGLVLRLPFQALDQTTSVSVSTIAGTDDESGHCTDGTLLGPKPAMSAGRFTDALPVSAAVPGVSSGLTPALDVAGDDFTYAMWFKFTGSASSPQRVLLWAYGPGAATQAQLWVQALYAPVTGSTSLRAVVKTDSNSTAQLETPAGEDFGDGAWHGFTLERQGGTVRFTVVGADKTVQADLTSTTPLTGSLTGTKASGVEGVRLGSRPDGANVLGGDIDEFRLYDHALSTSEITDVAAGGLLSPTSGLTVRWSMDDKYVYSIPGHRAAPGSTPATPDHSGWCNNAYVLNGGSPDPGGKDGTGLRLDGTAGTRALVPYSPSLALAPETVAPSTAPGRPGETSDFTVSLWFRYAATGTSPDQVLLWGYGAGSAERQVWLRASPTNHGIWADVETGTSGTRVLATDHRLDRIAFGDDIWHHVTLVRSGDSLTLAVDGTAEAPATLGDGALTATDTFAVDGLSLGGKLDGTQPLTGSLDEVRVYRQALSASDLTDLQGSTAPTDAAPVLWLPFDTIAPAGYSRM